MLLELWRNLEWTKDLESRDQETRLETFEIDQTKLPLKNLLQPPRNYKIAWERLVTFVYVKLAQMLILKVVYNS